MAIHDLNVGPYEGKETGESALLREILDCLKEGDIAVFDRYFCSFMMLAILRQGGVQFCARLCRELWVTLLAYNLVRRLIATAAAVHEKQPRQLGFTLACQTILSSWMLLATGACRDARQLGNLALERVAANEVANRPGRIEPRVIKRRRHRYPLMQHPRRQLREELGKTVTVHGFMGSAKG